MFTGRKNDAEKEFAMANKKNVKRQAQWPRSGKGSRKKLAENVAKQPKR